jgi:hypothetical protein
MSPPCDATAAITKSASTSTNTPIPAMTPRPLRSAQRTRDTGVERTTSSRRSFSSLAHAARNVAPASPAISDAKAKNASCRMPDG